MNTHCRYDNLLPLNEFKNHPRNPNKHDDDQIQRLVLLFVEHGIRHPIIVSKRSGFIVAGHGRKMAAKKLGLQHFPVVYQDFESDEQEYQFLVADNAVADWSELDLAQIHKDIEALGPFDLNLLGIKDFVLAPNEGPEEDESGIPEVGTEAKAQLGDLWTLGHHRLLCGDSTQAESVTKLMNGEKADMVFTDPPYGVDYNHTQTGRERIGGGKRPEYRDIANDNGSDLKAFLSSAIKELLPHLKDDWGGYWFYSTTKTVENFEALSQNGVKIGQYLIWKKNNHTLTFHKYLYNYEPFLFIGPSSNVKPNGRWFGEHQVAIWEVSKDTDLKHPTQKPTALAETGIQHISRVGESVIDPFLGSGSTLIACEKTNRKCFGIEIDPLYVDVIIQRWEKYSGREAVRHDGTRFKEL